MFLALWFSFKPFPSLAHWLAASGFYAPVRFATGRVPMIFGAGNMLIRRSVLEHYLAALIAATVRLNGWLLFASHDVTNRPSRYGVTADLLDFGLRRAREAGCRLVSVGQALELIRGA